MDVNFISKSGYSELVTSHRNSKDNAVDKCPVVEVATVCDISAVIQAENERSAYKTKDSEVSIIELIKYIIAHEVTELLVQQQLSESRVSSPVRSSEQSRTQLQEDLVRMKQRNTESRNVLLSLTRSYCSLFRCYTYKLGAHYAGSSDSVEQPVLLDYLMQILDGLLAWAKVLTSCIDMCDHSITRATSSPGRTKKSPKSVTKHTNASDHDKTVLEEVCECILQNAYKYWTTKLNYAQDIAFLLQCENVLTIYTPSRSSNVNMSAILSYSAIFASTNRTDTATKATLPPLLTNLNTISATSTSCIVQKILYKMLSRVCSQHVKVATQAMQSIQSPIIMVRYFLPRMTTAMVTYIFGTEVGRVTFMTGPGWENSRREDCLNLLVDKLRECRNVYLNFSTQLQISSTQLLDTTLELLQVIEDAE
uniref:Uncharacterized protein n=2 Tax=Spumella elongata TaxID=89044 RepID=A0A7S3MJZ8_9STRA